MYSHVCKCSYILSITLWLTLIFSTNCFAEDTLIFSAPPRETPEKGVKTYGPIAKHLSKILQRKIEYRHPGNWLSYSANMRKGKYDLVFDGPHFVSWRINRLNHTPVIKIPGRFIFRFVTRKENKELRKVDDLVGKRVCGHAPPNQSTLRLYSQLDNPVRQPILIQEKGWRNIYKSMLRGKCVAAILPNKIYKKVDPKTEQSKVLFTSNPVPGQAITVSSKFTRVEVVTIRETLLSEEGMIATSALRNRFASPKLTAASIKEYSGIHSLLANTYGFGMRNF